MPATFYKPLIGIVRLLSGISSLLQPAKKKIKQQDRQVLSATCSGTHCYGYRPWPTRRTKRHWRWYFFKSITSFYGLGSTRQARYCRQFYSSKLNFWIIGKYVIGSGITKGITAMGLSARSLVDRLALILAHVHLLSPHPHHVCCGGYLSKEGRKMLFV
ncbi:MAG: hypothetical protein U1E36_02400 [Rickettsiales bacterium]